MTQLTLFGDTETQRDMRPLPLIVADKWGFDLAYIEREDGSYIYSARDWFMGMGGSKQGYSNARKLDWYISVLPVAVEIKRERRQYETLDFCTENGLYIVAQNMRETSKRPQMKAIKEYLADAGVRLGEYRRDTEKLVTDAIDVYTAQGKSDVWKDARLTGIIARKEFTEALKNAVANADATLFAQSTEGIYKGLWNRTTALLRGDLSITKHQNPRDHMTAYGLIYTRLAEMLATDRLRDHDTVPRELAAEIIYDAAKLIGSQARQTSQALGIDLVTGRPLLVGGAS